MIKNHHITKLEGSLLEDAVLHDFGFVITNAEKVMKGYSSQVYKATMGDEVVYLRINNDKNVFEVEEIGYKIFEDKNIPVPKIIAYKENPKLIGHPTVIMSAAVGTTIGEAKPSPEDLDSIYQDIGRIVHLINETKLEGYGALRVKEGNLVGEFSQWKEYCDSQLERNSKALNFVIDQDLITNTEADSIRKLYHEISLLDFGKASLIHRDIHKGHVFVTGNKVSGVIDLGSLTASDPRYDIAMSLVFQDENEQKSFKKGYGDLANDPIVNKHMVTILIRKIYFRKNENIKGNFEMLLPKLKEALGKI